MVAAAKYARDKGYDFYVSQPKAHTDYWAGMSKQTANQVYRNTASKVAGMLGARVEKVSSAGLLHPEYAKRFASLRKFVYPQGAPAAAGRGKKSASAKVPA